MNHLFGWLQKCCTVQQRHTVVAIMRLFFLPIVGRPATVVVKRIQQKEREETSLEFITVVVYLIIQTRERDSDPRGHLTPSMYPLHPSRSHYVYKSDRRVLPLLLFSSTTQVHRRRLSDSVLCVSMYVE